MSEFSDFFDKSEQGPEIKKTGHNIRSKLSKIIRKNVGLLTYKRNDLEVTPILYTRKYPTLYKNKVDLDPKYRTLPNNPKNQAIMNRLKSRR